MHMNITRSSLPHVNIKVIGPAVSELDVNDIMHQNETQMNDNKINDQEEPNHIAIVESNLGQLQASGRHDIVISRCSFFMWKNFSFAFIIMTKDSNILIKDSSFTGFILPFSSSLIAIENAQNVTIQNSNFRNNQHSYQLSAISGKEILLHSVNFDDNFVLRSDVNCLLLCILSADFTSIENSAFISNIHIAGGIIATQDSNTINVHGNIFVNNSVISSQIQHPLPILYMNETRHTVEINNNSFILNKGSILGIMETPNHRFSNNLLHDNHAFSLPLIFYINAADVVFASNNITNNKAVQDIIRIYASGLIMFHVRGPVGNQFTHRIHVIDTWFQGNNFGRILMSKYSIIRVSNSMILSNVNTMTCFWLEGNARILIEHTSIESNSGSILTAMEHSQVLIKSIKFIENKQLDYMLPRTEPKFKIKDGSTITILNSAFSNNVGNLISILNQATLQIYNTSVYHNKGQYVISSQRNSKVLLSTSAFHGNKASEYGIIIVADSHLYCEVTTFVHNSAQQVLIRSISSEVIIINCNLTANVGTSYGVLWAIEMSVVSIENSSISFNEGNIGIGPLDNSSLRVLSSEITANKGLLANDFVLRNAKLHFHRCVLLQPNPQIESVRSANSTLWIAFSRIHIIRIQDCAKDPYYYALFEEEKEKQVSLWTFNSSFGCSRIDTRTTTVSTELSHIFHHSTNKFAWEESEYASCKFDCCHHAY